MTSLSGKKIVYIGDWVFYKGPTFIESPFEMVEKDCRLVFLGKPVTEALEKAGAEIRAVSNWDLYHMSVEAYDEMLDGVDLMIVSDVEARCFHLNPDFFDRSKYGNEIVTFPDRLKVLARAVENGLGLLYLGGWLSFSGHMEKGNWRRCPIRDWLPFTCLLGEDLMESSEGFKIAAVADHPVTAGLDLATVPPIMGYNEFEARQGMTVLWNIAETTHPLLGVSEHGAGRMVTYASDPVPHWGMNLMMWDQYDQLWQQMAGWAIRQV